VRESLFTDIVLLGACSCRVSICVALHASVSWPLSGTKPISCHRSLSTSVLSMYAVWLAGWLVALLTARLSCFSLCCRPNGQLMEGVPHVRTNSVVAYGSLVSLARSLSLSLSCVAASQFFLSVAVFRCISLCLCGAACGWGWGKQGSEYESAVSPLIDSPDGVGSHQ